MHAMQTNGLHTINQLTPVREANLRPNLLLLLIRKCGLTCSTSLHRQSSFYGSIEKPAANIKRCFAAFAAHIIFLRGKSYWCRVPLVAAVFVIVIVTVTVTEECRPCGRLHVSGWSRIVVFGVADVYRKFLRERRICHEPETVFKPSLHSWRHNDG